MNKILELLKQGGVFEISPKILGNDPMTKKEMVAIFNALDAFWEYEGEPTPEKPHAILKGGKHSNGFINCNAVLRHPVLCKLFANEIVKRFYIVYPSTKVDVVASSAYSAINLGYEVARRLSKRFPEIEHVIVEKDSAGNPTEIRGEIEASKNVLIINELMTTDSGSTWETKKAVLDCNGKGNHPAPNLFDSSFVLVHRSKDFYLFDGTRVDDIFHFDIQDWEEKDCPYCKAGSQAIKPKVGNNWNIIHGRT